MKLIIVTGLSGSGKSVALHTLEDLGYYCIDNLPVFLLPAFTQKLQQGDDRRFALSAVGIDARNPSADLSVLTSMLPPLQEYGIRCEVIYLEAQDETLIKRYSETRRRHPLSSDDQSLAEAIGRERELLAPFLSAADLRIDTYRSSGAGGQHVNKTDSAVRITHLPSGIVVECQDERSQHKNKARALSLLSARLLAGAQREQASAQAEDRRLQVGSGDRSERIRTYNYPQNRITDHRINLTVYKLDEVLEGALEQIIDPLTHEYQVEQLAALAASERR
ncbi:MAG: hypothetical protein B0D86_04285 [Candidatus Sedimenticola endophacoides]|nr:MAG: hypothetical protein B0D86_04285 [Candidatus Sedimenticola endophacoides]